MYFNGSNYFDGAVGVTQCGIPSGATFDYEVDTSLNVSVCKASPLIISKVHSGFTDITLDNTSTVSALVSSPGDLANSS